MGWGMGERGDFRRGKRPATTHYTTPKLPGVAHPAAWRGWWRLRRLWPSRGPASCPACTPPPPLRTLQRGEDGGGRAACGPVAAGVQAGQLARQPGVPHHLGAHRGGEGLGEI